MGGIFAIQGFDWHSLSAFFSVVAIDVTLAGDNAMIVGLAAAGLSSGQRRRAIVLGIMAAAILRIIFAVFAVQALQVVGLTAAGGLLLLWVSWKFWREIRAHAAESKLAPHTLDAVPIPGKTLRQAIIQIILADLSMSLDNVLAVAGAARQHVLIMVMGLALSVALMGLAASLIAKIIQRRPWIAYIGLAIVLYVALSMIWDGGHALFAQAMQSR